MKFYTVYVNPVRPSEIRLVSEGFSWLAFILGPFGLLLQKSWIHGLILLGLCFIAFTWFHPSLFLMGLAHFLIGCFAYSFQSQELVWSGWTIKTIIAGPNKQFAFLRLLDQYPDLKNKFSYGT